MQPISIVSDNESRLSRFDRRQGGRQMKAGCLAHTEIEPLAVGVST